MSTMKTQTEIVAEIKRLGEDGCTEDFFGSQRSDLLVFLEFEHAKEFLKEGVTRHEWDEDAAKDLTEDQVIAEIVDYLPFAWGKANDCRGLSAERSLTHFRAWFWLLGEDDFAGSFETYTMYGKAQLVRISEHPKVNYDWASVDNDRWTNVEGDRGVTAKVALGRS